MPGLPALRPVYVQRETAAGPVGADVNGDGDLSRPPGTSDFGVPTASQPSTSLIRAAGSRPQTSIRAARVGAAELEAVAVPVLPVPVGALDGEPPGVAGLVEAPDVVALGVGDPEGGVAVSDVPAAKSLGS